MPPFLVPICGATGYHDAMLSSGPPSRLQRLVLPALILACGLEAGGCVAGPAHSNRLLEAGDLPGALHAAASDLPDKEIPFELRTRIARAVLSALDPPSALGHWLKMMPPMPRMPSRIS